MNLNHLRNALVQARQDSIQGRGWGHQNAWDILGNALAAVAEMLQERGYSASTARRLAIAYAFQWDIEDERIDPVAAELRRFMDARP